LFPEKKEPVMLTVGRLWDEAKNIAILDAVATSLDWPVYVAGEVHHPDGGRVHLQAVHPLGRLEPRALAAWLRRAAIFVLPARYEPFGLAALEAGLAGCALVLGDLPTLREIWDGSALFVPPHDPAALAAALQYLSRDAAQRCWLARQARVNALRFTPERMARGYMALYAQLMRTHTQAQSGATATKEPRVDTA
jgi:glycosyltransferase involved in cell wall biosynthesis